jgi:hypothetical protein
MTEPTEYRQPVYAFPFSTECCGECFGMTLREWYAGLAMQGLASQGYAKWCDLASDAFNVADAMIDRAAATGASTEQ